jgi:endonuclease/exonuclease/phosphatase family metal-dependent hydrolase
MGRTSTASWAVRTAVAVAVAVWLCGCASEKGGRGDGRSVRDRPEPQRDTVRVMTQNLGYGGGAGLDVFTSAFSNMWKNVERSKPAERMAGVAESIDREQPDLVGLQEAVVWRTGGVLGGKADDVKYDFVKLLVDELRRRGLEYSVAARSKNADIEFPARVDGSIKRLRMTDQDVILARVGRGVRVIGGKTGNYRSTYGLKIGKRFEYKRGWAYVDAEVQGRPVRFVSTHLEVFDKDIQREQGAELADGPARGAAGTPVILVGDLNADADRDAASYKLLRERGELRDAWTEVRRGGGGGGDKGPTCCQADDYRNERSKLERRIDVVLYPARDFRPTRVDRVGAAEADRTRSGLWPSDHAGVVVDLAPAGGGR